MNRADRRAYDRALRKAAKEIQDSLEQKTEKTLNDNRVECMYCAFALALRAECGFGAKKIYKILSRIDDEMDGFIKGTEDLQSMRQRVKDEIGLLIELS